MVICNSKGKVWLVGAGPGDAGLLTVKAARQIENAEVVVYDHLVSKSVLAMVPPGAQMVDAGKIGHAGGMPQDEINALLACKAEAGKNILRLKGGDPFVFGRGGEEALYLLKRGIKVEIVPGITSAISAPASAGIPVTHRGISTSFHVITWMREHKPPGDEELKALAAAGGTIVILMGGRSIQSIGNRLISAGFSKDTPAAIITEATTAREQTGVLTLERMEHSESSQIGVPTIIVVGEVCRLREQLESTLSNRGPLAGVCVAIACVVDKIPKIKSLIEKLGGTAIGYPCIETIRQAHEETSALLEAIDEADWLGFVSAAGVRYFFETLFESGRDARALAKVRVAAIGPATAAALKAFGIIADFVPSQYDSETFGEEMSAIMKQGKGILIPRSMSGSKVLADIFTKYGISFCEMGIYDTVRAEVSPFAREAVMHGECSYVFLTSPSAARAFAEDISSDVLREITAVCIGKPTAEAAERLGMKIVVSANATPEDMVSALLGHLEK